MNWDKIKDRTYQYAVLMRLNRPIGIYLLLWPTVWALWIAGKGNPDSLVTLVFVLGVVLMRSAGCVINDYADRDFDPHVNRTRNRPIASGKVKTKEALLLFVMLCLVAFTLVLAMNRLTILLSFGGVVLAAIYPFMKRYTYLPQVFLGLAFGWAIPMAFAAQTGEVPLIAWLLLTANVLWATAYDSMYAMVDIEDDLKIGVKSTAILFGDADRIIIGSIQLLFIITMTMVGNKLELGLYYYLGLLVAALLAGYQLYLIRNREPEKCFKAFLNNHWSGAIIFAGLVLHYWMMVPEPT
jgi:4-hydroxybenzoate polyprenyltransferase